MLRKFVFLYILLLEWFKNIIFKKIKFSTFCLLSGKKMAYWWWIHAYIWPSVERICGSSNKSALISLPAGLGFSWKRIYERYEVCPTQLKDHSRESLFWIQLYPMFCSDPFLLETFFRQISGDRIILYFYRSG